MSESTTKPVLGSKGFLRAVLVVVLCFLLFAIFVPGNGARQQFNMWRAGWHNRTIQAKLDTDPRFRLVLLNTYTGRGGAMSVRGVVIDNQTLEDLRRVIDETDPPTEYYFGVEVLDVSGDDFDWLVQSHREDRILRLGKYSAFERLEERSKANP